MADRFLIGPYDSTSGLQTDLRPWAIPEAAFADLYNAYVYRGRVRKRFGSKWFGDNQYVSRFRMQIGTSDNSGNFSGAVPVSAIPAIGQMFTIGTDVFTVYQTGTPGTMYISGMASSATYDTTTGAVVIMGSFANTAVYFYPALPVMGLQSYDTPAFEDEFIVGFDTQYAYSYNRGWYRLNGEGNVGASVWSGSDSQFFWTSTWTGSDPSIKIFFVTNFNVNEANYMRYFDGTNWYNFRPQIDATPNYVFAARILVPFKNRLLAFNTWEGTSAGSSLNYQSRCRYSAIGDPTVATNWLQSTPGLGNAIDAPTTEAVVTVEFIKDRLIVFFERSTWELVYTGNLSYPFAWQQINTELGSESTFSVVPFDKIAIGVGNVGIHACNGANVERIDSKIPQSVFNIYNNNDGVFRVYGIRDYYVEMVYWTFPGLQNFANFPYPSRVLVYNYATATWAFNSDSITAFGYFQPPTNLVTWDSMTITWDDPVPWNDGQEQAVARTIVAGNQEGYTFVCDPDISTNAAVLQITDIEPTAVTNQLQLTIINHNLRDSADENSLNDYIMISGVTGTGNLNLLNGMIFSVTLNYGAPFSSIAPDPNSIFINYMDDVGSIISGTYSGVGVAARVNCLSITTKQFNFYNKQGRNAYISKIDFLIDKTDSGSMDVDFYASSNSIPLLQSSTLNGINLGTGTLDTFPYDPAGTYPVGNPMAYPAGNAMEVGAEYFWRSVYFQAEGQSVQMQITMNDAQMQNVNIAEADFQMHAMIIFAQPTTDRFN